MATKVKQLLMHGGTKVFYVAMTADSHGKYQQFSQDEVEKAGPGKFEIVESASSRHILAEFTPLAESFGPRWVKVPIREARPNETTQQRIQRGFEALGFSKEEATIASIGPQDQSVLETQVRGGKLMENLMTLER